MELVSTYYPNRLSELENLQRKLLLTDNHAHLSQLFIDKLIAEINMLWRAEKHYWSMTEVSVPKFFPKDYIVKKQQTILDLICHLHALLLKSEVETNRKNTLDVLADYIEIEYKLCSLLVEKERRIYEISQENGS